MKKKNEIGYPTIEKLIDSEDFTELNESFAKAYDGLEKVAGRSRSIKKGRDARKALRAIELTMELLKGLLALKYQIQEQLSAANKGKK